MSDNFSTPYSRYNGVAPGCCILPRSTHSALV